MSASDICVRCRMPKSRIVDRMVFQRRRADRWVEAAEHGVVPHTLDPSGPKAIPEEVKFDVRICRFAFPVLAVDDLGFCRMQLQVALCHSLLKLVTGAAGFASTHADHAGVAVEVPDTETDNLTVSTPGEKRALHQRTELRLASVDQ